MSMKYYWSVSVFQSKHSGDMDERCLGKTDSVHFDPEDSHCLAFN